MGQPAIRIEEPQPEIEEPLQLYDLPQAKVSACEESVASALGTSPVAERVHIQEFPEVLRQVRPPPDREILGEATRKLETEPNTALQSIADIPKSEVAEPKAKALSPTIAALVNDGTGSSLGGSSDGGRAAAND